MPEGEKLGQFDYNNLDESQVRAKSDVDNNESKPANEAAEKPSEAELAKEFRGEVDPKIEAQEYKRPEHQQDVQELLKAEAGKSIFGRAKERVSDFFSGDGKMIGEEKASELLAETAEKQSRFFSDKFKTPDLDGKKFLSALKAKKIFGADSLKFWAGFATGGAVRKVAKWGIGASGGFWAAAGIGALAGGSTEFVRSIIAEKERLRESPLTADQVFDKAKEIGVSNQDIKKKLDAILSLDVLETGYPELANVETFDGHKNELFQDLRKEIKADSINWKKVGRATLKGSIIGALGGTLGSVFSHFVFGAEDVKEIAKAASAAGGALSEEAGSHIQDQISDTYVKAYEGALSEGVASLDAKDFYAIADKGDSLTTVARSMIHDYISQKQSTGVEIALDKSQLVYAEDALKNVFEGRALNPGDELSLTGEQIYSAIEKAQLLTSAGKEHIKEGYVSQISDKVWEETTNYDSPFHSDNNFSEGILNNASNEAAEAVMDAKESIAVELAYREGSELYKDKVAVKSAENAAQWWIGGLVTAFGVGVAYKFGQNREKAKIEAEQEIELHEEDNTRSAEDEKYIDQALPKRISDEYLDKNKKEKSRVKKGKKAKVKTNPKSTELPKPDKKEDKNEIEAAARPPEEKKERSAESDPIYEHLKERGLNIKQGLIKYLVETPGGKEEFASYKEMAKWFNGLPQNRKDWLLERELNEDEDPPFKLSFPDELEKIMKESKLSGESLKKALENIVRNMMGVRERVPKTEEEIIPELEHKTSLTESQSQELLDAAAKALLERQLQDEVDVLKGYEDMDDKKLYAEEKRLDEKLKEDIKQAGGDIEAIEDLKRIHKERIDTIYEIMEERTSNNDQVEKNAA